VRHWKQLSWSTVMYGQYQQQQQPAGYYQQPHRSNTTHSHHSHRSQHSQGYGGHSQPIYQYSQPPPGSDPQLWQWFNAVDSNRSGSIDLNELKTALMNGNWTSFDLDTVKMLMGMFDVDRSGTIDFTEFSGLWKYISDWQNVFRHFDLDHSGSIEGRELADALKSFGYNLTPALLTLVEHKYASEPTIGYGPPPGITFDRFVRACVTVKTLTEAFNRADSRRSGWIQLNYDQFMTMVLSAP